MKKEDLKTGMQAKLRDGFRGVVMLDTPLGDAICGVGGETLYMLLKDYEGDLLCPLDKTLDIMAIYIPFGFSEMISKNIESLEWERKEEKTICELDGIEYSESTLRSIIKKATE